MPKASSRIISTDREALYAKPAGARTEFRVKNASNLVLRASASGAKVWLALYKSPTSGRRTKTTLGTYPSLGLAAAREAAQALAVAVRAGHDPAAERRAADQAETFASLAARYLAEHERRNARAGTPGRWSREAARLLRADVLPALGHHRAEFITRQQVADVVEAVAGREAYATADHVLGLVRAIYAWGNGTGAVSVDPTRGLRKRRIGRPRERVLSPAEIQTLWQALDEAPKLSGSIRTALKLELLLGVRIGEALGAEQAEIDLAGAVWTLPAGRTKASRAHALPLPPLALALLADATEAAGDSALLFPAPDGKAVRAKSAMRAVLRIRQRLGIDGIGTHDLRRTMATGLGQLGVADETIERILNHAPRTVASRHYVHARYAAPMREALEAWQGQVVAALWGAG